MSTRQVLIVGLVTLSLSTAASCAKHSPADGSHASVENAAIVIPLSDSLASLRQLTPDLPKFGDYVYITHLPQPVERHAPVYPDSALVHGVSGTVHVHTLVLADGTVGGTVITKSIPELDEAAAHAVQLWRFKPALNGDKPTAVWVAVPVTFTPK